MELFKVMMNVSIVNVLEAEMQKSGFKLPVFNPIALEVREAMRDNADLRTIEEILRKDAALASEILHVSNSAFFSGMAKVEDVHQAVKRLGTHQVYSVAVYTSLKQAFRSQNRYLNDLMQQLWRHASASAAACRWLAGKCGLGEKREVAYLAGLMHDLGSLVILKVLDQVLRDHAELQLSDNVIDELIATLHAKYGYRVMQSWELPGVYAEIARDHHLEENDKKNMLLQIVRLSDQLCAKLGIGLLHTPDLVLEALPETYVLAIKPVHLAELEVMVEDLSKQFLH